MVTDGKEVWVAYVDHHMLWFKTETRDNEEKIKDRLTHWAYTYDVPLPKSYQPDRSKRKDIWCRDDRPCDSHYSEWPGCPKSINPNDAK